MELTIKRSDKISEHGSLAISRIGKLRFLLLGRQRWTITLGKIVLFLEDLGERGQPHCGGVHQEKGLFEEIVIEFIVVEYFLA